MKANEEKDLMTQMGFSSGLLDLSAELLEKKKNRANKKVKNPLFFHKLHQMCTSHIPNAIEHLLKCG
jgi:hypothetical protein